jgi:hypothetical protein
MSMDLVLGNRDAPVEDSNGPALSEHDELSSRPPDGGVDVHAGVPATRWCASPLPARVRISAVVAVAVAAVYMIACVIYNLPSSTMKVRVDDADKALMQPWFEQDWQLFAPTPASSNAHLVISIKASESGSKSELAPFDAQYPIEDMQKRSPELPTKQPGITLAAQERFASYQKQLLVIEKAGGPSARGLHAQLDKTFAPTLDALDRFISYEAHKQYPTAQISQVRATFTSTPMTPFSERNDAVPPVEKTKETLQTNWFPYVEGVGAS